MLTDVEPRPYRVMPAPDCEPPFDAVDLPWPSRPGGHTDPCQGVLDLEFVLPSGLPARPRPAPNAAALRAAALPRPSGLPDPERWSLTLAQALAEVVCGDRPGAQLRHWSTAEVHEMLRKIRPGPRANRGRVRPGGFPVVRAVHLSSPAPGAIEVAAAIHRSGRAHALAFRLEARPDRWLCTVLLVG